MHLVEELPVIATLHRETEIKVKVKPFMWSIQSQARQPKRTNRLPLLAEVCRPETEFPIAVIDNHASTKYGVTEGNSI